jgi:hypothetical protein
MTMSLICDRQHNEALHGFAVCSESSCAADHGLCLRRPAEQAYEADADRVEVTESPIVGRTQDDALCVQHAIDIKEEDVIN